MKEPMQVFILVTVLLIVTACNDISATTSSPIPFFPQQRDAPNVYMDALLAGELVLIDGCLRVNDSDGNSYLLVWPQGFSLRIESNVIQVIDDTDHIVAQVGDKLEVSGGEMPGEYISEYLSQPLPSGCSGPYWIVGNEITR